MEIDIYRARQHADSVNSGWAEYSYSFAPIEDDGEWTGCGSGVYGRCWVDPTSTVRLRYDVPDGSVIDTVDDIDDTLLLFGPGGGTGYTAAEVIAGCVDGAARLNDPEPVKS